MLAEIWQKIVAFFMSIAAFFAGLFGINSNSGETLAVTTTAAEIEAAMENYDYPAFAGKEHTGTYVSSGDTVIDRWEHTTEEEFESYISQLRSAGFTLYDENRIEDNRFATLYKDRTALSVSRFAGTQTMRVIADRKGELCPLTDPYEDRFDTLLTGMKGETVVAAEGMGFIIRLADGSFCIIDGGMGDPDHVDSDKLMGILNAQKPADAEKPVVAAWIFTHLHGDHVGVFNCFSIDHHDDIVLERLYFNFPKEKEVADSDSPYMLDDTIYRYTQFKKCLAEYYPDVPVVKPHSGNRFAVRNADFEVLYAYDDLYPRTILNGGMNENSLLFKMTVGGQSVLWTGDFAFNAADLVLAEYGEALRADMLQLAHHGMNGTVSLYSRVDPTFALLPVWEGGLADMLGREQNKWLVDSPKLRQLIATCCGTWTVKLPYDPVAGSFERIPSETTVYPSYPSLLGE